MKKILFVAFMMISSLFIVNAQTVRRGDKIVNIGVGVATYNRNIVFPPLSVSLDYGVKDRLFDNKSSLTLGGYVGYYSNRSDEYIRDGHSYRWRYSNFLIGFRGALHYEFLSQLDTYVGAMLGYNIVTSKFYSTGAVVPDRAASGSGTDISAFLGAKYYFTRKFALFGEVGYGISAVRLGVTFKL